MIITLKQYDTGRPIRQALSLDGEALDLSGATVSLLWRRAGADDSEMVTRAATIINPGGGVVEYLPVPGDVSESGFFELEWKVILSGGGRVTLPTKEKVMLRIFPTAA